jgi:hypothetical protein
MIPRIAAIRSIEEFLLEIALAPGGNCWPADTLADAPFCPVVRWTPELRAAVAKGLDARIRKNCAV